MPLTPKEFHYAFANTLSEEESNALHERYAIPASGSIFWESALATLRPGHQGTYVNYKNDERAPLLFISGGQDHLRPASVQASNAKHYKSDTVTEVEVYEDRDHAIIATPGWEEVADRALEWALAQGA